MSHSRRKQNLELSRVVGILALELFGAAMLIALAGIAKDYRANRTQLPSTRVPGVLAARHVSTTYQRYRPQRPVMVDTIRQHDRRKSLPKIAGRRYNIRW